MNWTKSLIFCVSFFTIFFGEIAINVACGPEQDPYDYYVSFFHNNVQGDDYRSFAFNEMVYLYDSGELPSESDVNCADWANYLKIKKSDVKQVMYDLDSVTQVKLQRFKGKTTGFIPYSLKRNSFLLSLIKKPSIYNYYEFAKSCEPFVERVVNDWDPISRDTAQMIQKACDALDSINIISKNEFLKLRYAYQAARLFHYAGDYAQCKSAYQDFIKPNQNHSATKGWSTSLYAGALARTGKQVEAAYYFTKVFAENPERRVSAYRNYFYIDTTVQTVLAYAKNNNEKANIWAINGFHDPKPNITYLEKVYALNPQSELNGALLAREVNKLEQNLIEGNQIANDYFASYITRYNFGDETNRDSVRTVNLKHLRKVKQFALKLASERKYPQPALGTITAAYLSWIVSDEQSAVAHLKTLNVGSLNSRLLDQYRIVELLIKAKQIKKNSTFVADSLLPTLKWLDAKRFAEEKSDEQSDDYYGEWMSAETRFRKTTRNFYQQILAPAYQELGDTAMAALSMLKGDLHFKNNKYKKFLANMSYQTLTYWHESLGVKTMGRLQTLKNTEQKETIFNFLANGLNQLDADDFRELHGTAYLRRHQYQQAVAIFNTLSPKYKMESSTTWQDYETKVNHYATPFVETINDYPKTYVAKKPKAGKRDFANKMLQLKKLIINDWKNASKYYYQMANAVYQTGHFGNSWDYISYSWNAYDLSSKAINSYDNDYKLALTAKKWYLKARSLSKDSEFKAKCTFMIAKCEQKKIISDHPVKWYEGNYEQQRKIFLASNINNPYFKELKDSYAQTKFFNMAVGDCSYLRDFNP